MALLLGIFGILFDASAWAQPAKIPPVRERGLASGYSAWSPEWITRGKRRLRTSTGKPLCWWSRKVKKHEPIIAHRWLPCGTWVYVSVRGRSRGAWLRVGDRGPYGACAPRAVLSRFQRRLRQRLIIWENSRCSRYGTGWVWYVKRRARWPGHYRGIADLSHAARKRIGHNGWQHVTLRYWYPHKPPTLRVGTDLADLGLGFGDAVTETRDRRSQRRGVQPALQVGALGQARDLWILAELFDWDAEAVF